MALIQCKECKYQISTKTDTCPNCGAKNSKLYEYLKTGAIILFAYFLLYNLMLRSKSSNTPNQPPSEPAKTTSQPQQDNRNKIDINLSAAGVCMLFIKKNLHDPDSAQFGQSSDAYVTESDGVFKVIRQVRAKNGFGAMRLSNYECSMIYKDEHWYFKSLRELKN